jgi:hypothetical protein
MEHAKREELSADYTSQNAGKHLNSRASLYSVHSSVRSSTSRSTKGDRDIRNFQASAAEKFTRESKTRAQHIEISFAGHYCGQDGDKKKSIRFAACTKPFNTHPPSLKSTARLPEGQNSGDQRNYDWQYPPHGRDVHRIRYAILDQSTQVTGGVNEGMGGVGLEQEKDFEIWENLVTKVKATRVGK